jgi:hypothetical protein
MARSGCCYSRPTESRTTHAPPTPGGRYGHAVRRSHSLPRLPSRPPDGAHRLPRVRPAAAGPAGRVVVPHPADRGRDPGAPACHGSGCRDAAASCCGFVDRAGDLDSGRLPDVHRGPDRCVTAARPERGLDPQDPARPRRPVPPRRRGDLPGRGLVLARRRRSYGGPRRPHARDRRPRHPAGRSRAARRRGVAHRRRPRAPGARRDRRRQRRVARRPDRLRARLRDRWGAAACGAGPDARAGRARRTPGRVRARPGGPGRRRQRADRARPGSPSSAAGFGSPSSRGWRLRAGRSGGRAWRSTGSRRPWRTPR